MQMPEVLLLASGNASSGTWVVAFGASSVQEGAQTPPVEL